jgi:hypothetical protein
MPETFAASSVRHITSFLEMVDRYKVPAASHQLLQSDPGLLAVTIDIQGIKPKFHRYGNVCW